MVRLKTKEFDISNDDRPKMEKIGDYWSEEQATKIVNLLKEFQDVLSRNYKYIKGLFHEMGEMKIEITGASLVDQYTITLVHIVGFKIVKN